MNHSLQTPSPQSLMLLAALALPFAGCSTEPVNPDTVPSLSKQSHDISTFATAVLNHSGVLPINRGRAAAVVESLDRLQTALCELRGDLGNDAISFATLLRSASIIPAGIPDDLSENAVQARAAALSRIKQGTAAGHELITVRSKGVNHAVDRFEAVETAIGVLLVGCTEEECRGNSLQGIPREPFDRAHGELKAMTHDFRQICDQYSSLQDRWNKQAQVVTTATTAAHVSGGKPVLIDPLQVELISGLRDSVVLTASTLALQLLKP